MRLTTGYGLGGFGAKPPRPVGGPLEISIRVIHREGVAPFGAHFEAMVAGGGVTNKFRDLHFVWDFDDPGATYTNLEPTAVHGADANSAIGPHAAHVYNAPGVFTPRVTAYWREGGAVNSATATADPVTVADPEIFFAPEDIVVCSLAGDFTGAPAGAEQVTTVEDAIARVGAFFGRDRMRLLFRGGETYIFDDNFLTIRNVRVASVGAFGPGRPMIQGVNSGASFDGGRSIFCLDVENVSIEGVEFVGGYDPTTATLAPNAEVMTPIFVAVVERMTVTDIRSRGAAITIYPLDDMPVGALRTISNCDIGDWADNGILGGGHNVALLGNRIRQNPATLLGPDAKQFGANPIYADHGPARIKSTEGRPWPVHIYSRNDLYARGGWSGYGASFAHQPCLRVQLPKESGCRVVMTQNSMEGGLNVLAIGALNAHDQISMKGLIEGNYLVGDEQTDSLMGVTAPGAVIRNNVGVKPDVPEEVSSFRSFIDLNVAGGANLAVPPETVFEHNTLVNLQSAANIGPNAMALTHPPTDPPFPVTERNNVLKADNAPNAASFTDYEPLDAGDFFRPQAGSAAIGAVTSGHPVADFFGSIRGAATEAGASETAV